MCACGWGGVEGHNFIKKKMQVGVSAYCGKDEQPPSSATHTFMKNKRMQYSHCAVVVGGCGGGGGDERWGGE